MMFGMAVVVVVVWRISSMRVQSEFVVCVGKESRAARGNGMRLKRQERDSRTGGIATATAIATWKPVVAGDEGSFDATRRESY